MSPRSYLYVPADRPEMLAKAGERGADALIVDLEDAVAPSRKVEARRILADFLPGPIETWVRVNSHPDQLAEDAAVAGGAAGIVLAKAEPETLSRAVSLTSLPIMPLVETAAGLQAASELASADGVERLAVGEADLSAELGVTLGDDEVELLYARSQLVVASAAAGIDAPSGPVFTDFRDSDGLRRSTEALVRLGFGSRPAIHPAQVQVINEVFTPTEEQVSDAREMIEGFEAAVAAGAGVAAADGVMIDEAVVRQARRVLDRVPGGP
ncbi:MAG: CoA ester lyase [Acidimicrobiaceae bacterium]|nr:CoA ester lyase [Acidimicrobiaceae bacterium]MYG99489.1 CoA ester lyase [Acidimicrobiaceae bacterium]MYL02862.1 CoA ester lyase [Acidimicrobiaceae bacterium]